MSRGSGVLVARSREGNVEMLRMLSARGIKATGVEVIAFEDPESWSLIDDAILDAPRFDWVVLTSPRGVESFGRRMKALGKDAVGLRARFAAVGPKTASCLGELGIGAEFVPSEFLTSKLGRELPGGTGTRVLLLRADMGDKKLVEALKSRRFEVEDVVAYHTRFVRGPIDQETIEDAEVVLFASPSEVEGLRRSIGGAGFSGLAARATAACIGPVTAAAAERAGFGAVVFPGEHTLEALADKVGELLLSA